MAGWDLHEDRQLAERLRGKDADAWIELFVTYARPLFLYAYFRNGRDPATAEDVRQETLISAARDIGNYRGEIPLFAWLCGIARRKLVDEARAAGKYAHSLDDPAVLVPPGDFSRLGVEPLPDELIARAETRAAIVEALWSLPDDYRFALVGRYVEKMSVADLAAWLGRSYKATESLLLRARRALRRRLVKMHEGRGPSGD